MIVNDHIRVITAVVRVFYRNAPCYMAPYYDCTSPYRLRWNTIIYGHKKMVAYHQRRCSLYTSACIHRLRSQTTYYWARLRSQTTSISWDTTRRNTIVIWRHVIRRNTVGYVPFVERLHQYTVVYGFRNLRPELANPLTSVDLPHFLATQPDFEQEFLHSEVKSLEGLFAVAIKDCSFFMIGNDRHWSRNSKKSFVYSCMKMEINEVDLC